MSVLVVKAATSGGQSSKIWADCGLHGSIGRHWWRYSE
jgi:hypothetical protein